MKRIGPHGTAAFEEELGRISKEVDSANPQQGTFGLALLEAIDRR